MLYFGSRDFGQGNFGYGIRQATVDEIPTQSTMLVSGLYITSDIHYEQNSVADVLIEANIVKTVRVDIASQSTIIASKVLMEWHPKMATSQTVANTDIAGKLAWDAQLVDDTTWTNQIVE